MYIYNSCISLKFEVHTKPQVNTQHTTTQVSPEGLKDNMP